MLRAMRSRTKSLLACLIGVAVAIPALAQQSGVTQYPTCPDPPPKLSQAEFEAAKASYKVGVEAFEASDYRKALDNIKDAFRRDCSKVALLEQLARIYEAMGDKPEAIHALETYLQRNPKADDADRVQTRIQNLKAQLGTSATITATATTAAPTATVTATATSTATAIAPTATATATVAPSGGHTAGPWVVFGVGVAAAIAGGVLIGVGQSNIDASRSGCTVIAGTDQLSCNPPPSLDQRSSDQNTGNILRGTGIAAAGVGLAAIVGGLIWHFVEPSAKNAPTSSFLPVLGPGVAGFAYTKSF